MQVQPVSSEWGGRRYTPTNRIFTVIKLTHKTCEMGGGIRVIFKGNVWGWGNQMICPLPETKSLGILQ